MKKLNLLVVLFAFGALILNSCSKDSNNSNPFNADSYIINYGNYGTSASTISAYSSQNDTVSNNYYKNVNSINMTSNVQYAYQYNGKIYFMGNSADEVFYVNENSFEQTAEGISGSDIVKPRYCVADGNYLYVSCWDGDVWSDLSLGYIAKIDLTSNTVKEKIDMPGGPEGLAIANNKLYVALNYDDSIAVVNLSNNDLSYIPAPAVSSYFIKDNNDNLYVSLVGSFSVTVSQTGLGYINTTTDELTVFPLDGISSEYANIIEANDDYSKIYVVAASWVEDNDGNWSQAGSIATFNTSSQSFEAESFLSNLSGIKGVEFHDGNVFTLISNGNNNGVMNKYSVNGELIKAYEVGLDPTMILTVE